MPKLEHIGREATDALARAAFGSLGCADYGVVIMAGASSWGTHDTGRLVLPHQGGDVSFMVSYDEREAPYATDETGREKTRVMLSLSDEDKALACAWACTNEGSPLLGVGVDLCSAADFDTSPSAQRYIDLLFSEQERALVQATWPDDLALGYATAFGAKEAAFKATAQPLRAWYRSHQEELAFEVRHFGLVSAHEARGELRNGAAQAAMRKMGIARIQVSYVKLGDAALVVACALSR